MAPHGDRASLIASLQCAVLTRELSNMAVQRKAFRRSTGLAHGKRYSEDGVCTQALLVPTPFILRAIKLLVHEFVDGFLVDGVLANQGRPNHCVDALQSLRTNKHAHQRQPSAASSQFMSYGVEVKHTLVTPLPMCTCASLSLSSTAS